jgi:Tol biopolymer transport system component
MPSGSTVSIGSTLQLTPTLKDASGNALNGRIVTWSSSDESVAKVDASGLVTAVGPGTATITATSEGKSGTATITVGSPSPQVAFIAFPDNGCCAFDVYMERLDGTGRVKLTDFPDPTEHVVRWSPNGALLGYNRDHDIYTMNPDVVGSEQLLVSEGDMGAFSPDGRRLVFTRGYRLYEKSVGDNTPAQPISLPADVALMDQGRPDVAADGRIVYFAHNGTIGPTIYLRAVDGSVERLTFDDVSQNPSFSPDGTHIVYNSGNDIYVMDLNDPVRPRRSTLISYDPRIRGVAITPWWSPDGKTIVFARLGGNVYYMNPDGTGVTQVSATPHSWEKYPTIRPAK